MADLQQIVGAILRDLAKARFGADLYSRSIARYYENDYLLRKFPVPRADVDEVEIDLKFSITGVEGSEVNNESQEANAAVLFERSVERMVATFLDEARRRNNERDEDDESNEKNETNEDDEGNTFSRTWWKYLSKGFNSTVLRIEMRQKVLRYFIESYTHVIDDKGKFHEDVVLGELERPFRWAMEAFAHEEYIVDEKKNREMKRALRALIEPIIKDDNEERETIKKVLEAMADPIRTIWQGNSDARLDVLVEGGQLSQLSEAAISSVKIKAVVRNMIWTEVKVSDRVTRHALTSE